MAAVAPSAEPAEYLQPKLSLDSQPKAQDAVEATKKPTAVQGKSANGEAPTVQIPSDRSLTPGLSDFMDAGMCYMPNSYASHGFYYGSYDGTSNDWNHGYVNHDGVEMPPGVYGDMYHGYGYAPYSPYPSAGSPVPTIDGQLYGPQHYQYPPIFQPQTPTTASHVPSQTTTTQNEVSTSVAVDQPAVPVNTTKANSNGIPSGNVNGNCKGSHQNPSLTHGGRGVLPGGLPSAGYQDSRFGFDAMRAALPYYDGPVYSTGQHRPNTANSVPSAVSHNANTRNHNQRPVPHLMGMHTPRLTNGMGPAAPPYINRIYPANRPYNQYGNALKNSLGFGSSGYDSRTNLRSWGMTGDNKYKPRGRGNGFCRFGYDNQDGVGELNRGPRGDRTKFHQKTLGPNVTIAVKGQTLPTIGKEDTSVVPDKEQYNRADFPEKYINAKFFVIKSYSEDDVHKSIKYNVWASTPNGNKKLDAGYQEAQEKAGGCPVFLFFSVNTSGQFVGVAEMVGPVDFNKTVEYWQQDKWNGCFPVKWHIVKDVPNSILKHITLENNDNKPVTNSRDTQEVKLEQGLEMLKIFMDHVSKTSILDDFVFYEDREKVMQEKRVKQQQPQRQIWDGRTPDNAAGEREKDGVYGKPKLQKPLESVSILSKEAPHGGLAERKPSEENSMGLVAGDSLKVAKSSSEKIANGVANS
ncbi:uncharacterized protein LOC109721772 [Ananas comosus]|uniref:YTH domain-containing family protein n=1 Tax=Ananas comosus TaxID=4615 RepID=A0A6P5G949_ANACO|nr:uncharacterized protein LOC109721772 [Ananas comosus]